MAKEQVGFSLAADVRRTIDALAAVRHVAKSQVVADAVMGHVRTLSDAESAAVQAVVQATAR